MKLNSATDADEIEQGGDEVSIGQSAGVAAIEHEIEAQHSRLDQI